MEALIALAMAYRLTGRADVWAWYEKVHAYAWAHFPDPEYGEWYGYLNRQGEVLLPLKGGKWKGGFHVPRSLYRCWQEFERLSGMRDIGGRRQEAGGKMQEARGKRQDATLPLPFAWSLINDNDNFKNDCSMVHTIEELVEPPYLWGEWRCYQLCDAQGRVTDKRYRTHNFAGYAQRYERVADVLRVPHLRAGPVLVGTVQLLGVLVLWSAVLAELRQSPLYFVECQ